MGNSHLCHVSDKFLTQDIDMLEKKFGIVGDNLTIFRGKIHDYLGMNIRYSIDMKENITI